MIIIFKVVYSYGSCQNNIGIMKELNIYDPINEQKLAKTVILVMRNVIAFYYYDYY